jgi:hypothetical protein
VFDAVALGSSLRGELRLTNSCLIIIVDFFLFVDYSLIFVFFSFFLIMASSSFKRVHTEVPDEFEGWSRDEMQVLRLINSTDLTIN